MTVTTVAPGILRVRVPIPFDLDHVNLYVVDTGDGLALLDTGVGTDETFRAIEEALGAAHIGFADLRTIVVTHFHADHAGLAGRLRPLADAPIVMSGIDGGAIDRFFGEGPPVEPEAFFVSHGAPGGLGAVFHRMLPMLRAIMIPFSPDVLVGEGERIPEAREMRAVLTPGHTAGHMTVHVPGEGLLFSGDHVLPHITPNIGLYATSDPRPLHSYLESLEAVQRLAPRRILPAHGDVIEAPEERIEVILGHHRRRIDHTASAVTAGSTAWDVTRRLFGERPDPLHAWMALFESLAHLQYLVDEGVIHQVAERERVVYCPA